MEQKQILDYAPAAKTRCTSLILLMCQIPYGVIFMLFIKHPRGEPKRLLFDSLTIALALGPTLLSLLFAMWELTHRDRNSRVVWSIVTLALAAGVVMFYSIVWYYDLWLDPKGTY